MADGISSSAVSQLASETAVRSFLEDYYCTSETWTVRTACLRVLAATNSWLDAQTRRGPYHYQRDRGYVCTFSALILRGDSAHLCHVGDTRIYRLRDGALEQLTSDHRQWIGAGTETENSVLSRALGMAASVEADYRMLPLRAGDLFALATDGVYEHLPAGAWLDALQDPAADLDAVARSLVATARDNGSDDNLSLQLVRVEALPESAGPDLQAQAEALPLPPTLQTGVVIDGYRIVRALHASNRSHTWLAADEANGTQVVLKTPATEQSGDPDYLERFLLEEWIARRINSVHVLKAAPADRQRSYLYTATEYLGGATLAQWLRDHPRPDLASVRDIVTQVARGLRAFHRLEMLHRDLRPENVMIDSDGTVKLIDFGAVHVAGLAELGRDDALPIPGTALYTAPEYFRGEPASPRSDLFSLGVLAYHLLSGRFPYGTAVAKARSAAAQRRLRYRSVLDEQSTLPAWVDEALRRAVHPDPLKRYGELSEFVYDLHHPNRTFLARERPPLIQRNPLAFWQGVALVQLLAILALLYHLLT